jgi:phage terminase small subunit
MPRRSNAALTSPYAVIDAPRTRLSPPGNLDKNEVRIFRSIVGNMPARHFARADLVLLVRHVQNLAAADIAAAHLKKGGIVDGDGKISPWLRALEKLDRSIVSLATKLRLTPSSRFDSRAAARNSRGPEPSVYDQLNSIDFDDDGEDHVDSGAN